MPGSGIKIEVITGARPNRGPSFKRKTLDNTWKPPDLERNLIKRNIMKILGDPLVEQLSGPAANGEEKQSLRMINECHLVT
ncbi:hypothetical protein C5167_026491 [Papaver somniferum]|nr:hypothetical protein C5167_026491 [Papaver somniferum]